MKKLLIPCPAAAFATSFVYAAPADDVKAAAKKLSDATSYAWTTKTENAGGGGGGFGAGATNGVTEKGGYTLITRESQMGSMQTLRKGEQVVMQDRDGNWVTREEMMAQFGGGQGGPGGGQGGQRGMRGGMFGGGVNPAEEAATLVDSAKDLKVADGAIVGTLSEEAVAQRLNPFGRPGGQPAAAPKNASGTVKFWVKDGALTKYELNVKGTTTGRDGQERQTDRTTTTEIKDIGSTKVTVPDAAKKKLGA